MKKIHLLPLLLILVVALSGCISPRSSGHAPRPFKGEVITIDNVDIFPSEAYSGEIVSLDFDIINNVETEIKNFRIELSEPSFLKLKQMKCGELITSDHKCAMNLKPFAYEHFHAEFEVLPIISQSVDQIVYYKIMYDYNGSSMLSFQIVDWDKIKEHHKVLPYQQHSSASDIKIVFEPGFLTRKTVNNKVVTIRDYMVAGTSFLLQLTPKYMKSCQNCIAYVKQIELQLQSVVPKMEGCPDFRKSSESILVSKEKDIKVPPINKLTCTFTNTEIEQPITQGIILAKYDYNMTKIYQAKITVRRR
ncbi:MAG: hypothetical protein J7K98_00875 [Candidatus Aenigmarchaeota archaeon]|nr:hypothetical protein [Candidatus Aenigmarchaeota archaeon]